jgi:hypothetical protein
MATIQLPPDFKEFLQLLNSGRIEYLDLNKQAIGRSKDLNDLEHLV